MLAHFPSNLFPGIFLFFGLVPALIWIAIRSFKRERTPVMFAIAVAGLILGALGCATTFFSDGADSFGFRSFLGMTSLALLTLANMRYTNRPRR